MLMNDFFDRYKKYKILHHIWLLSVAFMIALWVHFMIISWDIWKNITASVFDISQEENIKHRADIYAEIEDNVLFIRNWQNIDNLNTINFTIAYNPELWVLDTSQIWWLEVETQIHENEPWLIYVQLILQDEYQNLPAESRIARLPYTQIESWRQFFNIIQASFIDGNEEIYLLTSSWIEL